MSKLCFQELLCTRIKDFPSFSKAHTENLIDMCTGDRLIDLLFYLPKSYIDRRLPLISAKSGDIVTFIAVVTQHIFGNKRKNIPHRVVVNTEIGRLQIIFFNYSLKHLLSSFVVEKQCLISGKLSNFSGKFQLVHPDYISNDISKYNKVAIIEATYNSYRNLKSSKISYYIKLIIDLLPDFPEWLDENLILKNHWVSFTKSLKLIHIPASVNNIENYRSRLSYDELLSHFITIKSIRNSHLMVNGYSNLSKKLYYDSVLKKLGFELTKSQVKVIEQITEEQESHKRMICLLQGDVGSGKTIVGLFAALNVVENGNQVAFMAPTEILIEQHYEYFSKILSDFNIPVCLLTGKIKGKKREVIKNNLENGSCKIVMGTHALFQEEVRFYNLNLVIIDEQQRFGVMQRMSLIEKGNNADILFMTATPIPRTLQQILYGDMKCLRLMEKPECRLPVYTTIISISKLSELISRLSKLLEQGEKIYWVCPYIEESEHSNISAVENRFFELKKLFGKKVGIMHGKLPCQQKEDIMISFRENIIQILVSTTVIEVGVDVSDATIIIIENAERFGLSQLHQLRGRVGRGNKQSFCILLCDNLSKSSYRKLTILCKSHDGFEIAEQDLLFRGSGNVFGLNQSGIINFKFVNLNLDQHLIELANHEADKILKHNSQIELNERIKILLNSFGCINSTNIKY